MFYKTRVFSDGAGRSIGTSGTCHHMRGEALAGAQSVYGAWLPRRTEGPGVSCRVSLNAPPSAPGTVVGDMRHAPCGHLGLPAFPSESSPLRSPALRQAQPHRRSGPHPAPPPPATAPHQPLRGGGFLRISQEPQLREDPPEGPSPPEVRRGVGAPRVPRCASPGGCHRCVAVATERSLSCDRPPTVDTA